MLDYEKDTRISEDDLDLECLEQPTLFMRYAKNLAQAEREKDAAKEKLEFIKAELDREIRLTPEKFKVEKITDKVVENTILLQDRYKKASEAYLDAKFEYTTAKGGVDAMNVKKDMLENLTKLMGQSYFAGPRTARDLSKEREIKNKKVDSGVAQHLTRSRR